MLLKGQKLGKVRTDYAVFKRPDGDVVLHLNPIPDPSEFEKIYPQPEVPTKMGKGGAKIQRLDDPGYLEKLKSYSEAKWAWIILQTIKDTPELEFEVVKLEDPNTWTKYREELKESGFTEGELLYLTRRILETNSLDQSKLDEARDAFLAEQSLTKS